MLAYMTLKPWYESEKDMVDKDEGIKESKELAMSHSPIEHCVKVFRKRESHHSVKDLDEKYSKDKSLWVAINQIKGNPSKNRVRKVNSKP